jgi:hypothetical protein
MKRKAKGKQQKAKAGKRVNDLTAKDSKQVKGGGKVSVQDLTARVDKASPILF